MMWTDWLMTLRYRVAPSTVVAAIAAASGVLIVWIALTAVQRISLRSEAERVNGLVQPSWWETLELRFQQTGLDLSPREFLLMGVLIGAALSGALLLLGFVTAGVLMFPVGFVSYYQWLMRRRTQQINAFREQLPEAIEDTLEYLRVKNNLPEVIALLSQEGPPALRPAFAKVGSLIARRQHLSESLITVGRERGEPCFAQFMNALAQHVLTGTENLDEVLRRIALAQRGQIELQQRIVAAQAGAHMLAWIYAIAPLAFMVFMRLAGGQFYADFYGTLWGQVAQVFVFASGVLAWWLTQRVAQRGLYLEGNLHAKRLPDEAHLTGFQREPVMQEAH